MSIVAALVVVIATVATTWYLAEGFPWTFVDLVIAVMVLVGPFVTRWPVSLGRCLVAAAVWLVVGGFPLFYLFGGFVFTAAPLLALGTTSAAVLQAVKRRASPRSRPV